MTSVHKTGASELGNERQSEDVLLARQLEDAPTLAITKDDPPVPSQDTRPTRVLRILDSLGYGGILLRLKDRTLFFNLCAQSNFGKGLVLHNGVLSATDRKSDQQLQSMIAAALSGKEFPVSLAMRRADRLPLIIRTLCLDKYLVLLVLDPEVSLVPPGDVLAQMFGLTPTEVEVTIGIASGKSLSEIAAERGVKVGTVRAHSKVVFSKTHTHSQAHLMRVLMRLAMFMPIEQSPQVLASSLGI